MDAMASGEPAELNANTLPDLKPAKVALFQRASQLACRAGCQMMSPAISHTIRAHSASIWTACVRFQSCDRLQSLELAQHKRSHAAAGQRGSTTKAEENEHAVCVNTSAKINANPPEQQSGAQSFERAAFPVDSETRSTDGLSHSRNDGV